MFFSLLLNLAAHNYTKEMFFFTWDLSSVLFLCVVTVKLVVFGGSLPVRVLSSVFSGCHLQAAVVRNLKRSEAVDGFGI